MLRRAGSKRIWLAFIWGNCWRISSEYASLVTIYILSKIYGPEFDYLIIGKRADGKFVKYIDTREITKRYFGWNMQGASTAMYKDLNVQGDTLVMKYHDWKTATEGRFIFKWDDNAQWFSVDRTVDNVRSGY